MRFSLHHSACTSAVALTLIALPCLAQPASSSSSNNVTVKQLTIPCKDVNHLSDCIARMKAQDAGNGKLFVLPGADQQKLNEKLKEMMSRTQQSPSSVCYKLKVYKFSKDYPEKNAKEVPSVTDCESASLFQEKTTVFELPVSKAHR